MKTPKTLRAAMVEGYTVKGIYKKGHRRCRVDVSPRLFTLGKPSVLSFWLTSKYVARMYPSVYNRF